VTVLLTGATGFVGMEVLARLLEDGSDDSVLALVRGRDREEATARLGRVLDGLGADADARRRVRALPGNLTEPGLGLGSEDQMRVAESVTDIVHCAASISFTLPIDEARAINVEGTRRVLEVAERLVGAHRVRRLVYVSTAYVAGEHQGRFGEDELAEGQCFRNSYEQSKAEAEALVREAAERMPTAVVRPSIVVGESDTGWTPAFNVLYWPLRAFDRGLLPAIPARPDGRVDVVPVDFVADAIVHLLRDDRAFEGTVAAAAGDEAATVEELLDLASTALGRPRPPLAPLANDLARNSDEAAAYMPYFDMEVVFDTARAREALGPAGIAPPPLEAYFATLVAYARRARWGKAPLTRAQAREALPAAA
jgi:thioester reductase-like protein